MISNKEQQENILVNLGCSAFAAFITRCVTHPLDTIKTRMQLVNHPINHYSNLIPSASSAPLGNHYSPLLNKLTPLRSPNISPSHSTNGSSSSAAVATPTHHSRISGQHGNRYSTLSAATASINANLNSATTSIIDSHNSTSNDPSTQNTTKQSTKYDRHSLRGTIRRMYQREGIRSFYAGLSISLFFSVPGLMVYLTSYDSIKSALSHRLGDDFKYPVFIHGFAAGLAEAASGLFWTPMEVIKNKQQSGRFTEGTWRLTRNIIAQEGIFGLMKGYTLSLAVFVPYTMIYFITYEKLKQNWANNPKDIPFHGFILSSALAGALSGAVSNLMDVVKTRIQVGSSMDIHSPSGSPYNDHPYSTLNDSNTTYRRVGSYRVSTLEVMRNMWRYEGGLKAFTRGMSARILWVTPSVTISMTTYEMLKRMYNYGPSQ